MTPIFPKNKTALTFTLTAIMALTTLSPAMASSADDDDEGAAGAAAAAARPKACDDSDTKPFGTDHPIFRTKKALLTKDVDKKNFDSLFTPLMTDEEGRVLAQEVLTKCNDTIELRYLLFQFQSAPDEQVSLVLGIFQDTGILAKCKDIMQLLTFIDTDVLKGLTTEEARKRCNMLQETGVLDQYDDGDLAGDQVGEVLKALLHLTPEEARTRLNITKETGILKHCTTDDRGRNDLVNLLAELNGLKDDRTRKQACQKLVAAHEAYVTQWRAAGAAAAAAATAPTNTYQAPLIEAHEAAIAKLRTETTEGKDNAWNRALRDEKNVNLLGFMALFEIAPIDHYQHVILPGLLDKLLPFLENEDSRKVLNELTGTVKILNDNFKYKKDFDGWRQNAMLLLFDILKVENVGSFTTSTRALLDTGVLQDIGQIEQISSIFVQAQEIAPTRLDLVIRRTKDLFGTLPELNRPDFHFLLHYTKEVHQGDWEDFKQLLTDSPTSLGDIESVVYRFCKNDPEACLPDVEEYERLDDKTLINLRDNPGAYLYHTTFIPETSWVEFIDHLIQEDSEQEDSEPEAVKTSDDILALIKEKYHAWRGSERTLVKAARASADEGAGAAGAAAAGAAGDE